MRGLRRHRRYVAWLAVLTLVGNAVVGALCLAPASGKTAALTDEVLGAYVICTSNAAAAATDHDGGSGRAPANHCPACLLLAGFALLAAVALVLLVFPKPPALAPALTFVRTLADHLSLGGVRSRAPPLPA